MSTSQRNRREFILTSALAGMGMGMLRRDRRASGTVGVAEGLKVGIIGLDTSHSTAFTKSLNTAQSASEFLGYRVVAAYPQGSLDIKSSVDRIPASRGTFSSTVSRSCLRSRTSSRRSTW